LGSGELENPEKPGNIGNFGRKTQENCGKTGIFA
jgi:hypothetical protein